VWDVSGCLALLEAQLQPSEWAMRSPCAPFECAAYAHDL